MAAGTYDFTIEQGATFSETFTWKDSQTPPQPVPIFGYSARMMIRQYIDSSVVLADISTTNSKITILDTGTTFVGQFKIVISATETAGYNWPINPGDTVPRGLYDLELVSPSGFVTRLLKGTVTLDREVTR